MDFRGWSQRIRDYSDITNVGPIVRRYFVIGAFDGALTILGVIIGAYAGGAGEEEKALVRQLVRELPADGGERLLRLEPRVRGSPPLRRLVVDLLGRWTALVYHQQRPWVPATNNRTEQAIGKSKVRFKTVRGFKSVAGALAGIALTQWVYSGAHAHDLRELAA